MLMDGVLSARTEFSWPRGTSTRVVAEMFKFRRITTVSKNCAFALNALNVLTVNLKDSELVKTSNTIRATWATQVWAVLF